MWISSFRLPANQELAQQAFLSGSMKINETVQAARNQINDSFQCQVASARGKRKDWIVDADPAQERECEASFTRDDDGGGNDQQLPFSSRSPTKRQRKSLVHGQQNHVRCRRRRCYRHGNGGDYAGRRRTGDQGANGSTQSPCSRPAGAGRVGGHHTNGAPRLDFLDKLSQATGNAQAPNRESVRHACVWKATIMLFSRHKVADEKERKIVRNVASVGELKESYFAKIDES